MIKNRFNGIQMDFKYLCFRKSFLNEFLNELKKYGINTILLEMEDYFPFTGRLESLRARDYFTPDEFRIFLDNARALGFTLIPLVQSLGHLEFILRHREYASLREVDNVYTQICPSNEDAVKLVFELIDEVLAYFPEEEFFHIGGDEAWFIGKCAECAEKKEKAGEIGMWLSHETRIMKYLIGKGKRPVVWDDIFWKEPSKIHTSGLPKEVVLMSWNYAVGVSAKNGNDGNNELGISAEKQFRIVDEYVAAGYDVIGCPCCNYGQSLFPRNTGSIGNIRAWAAKSKQAGLAGVICSSWACFHVPLQTQLPLYAASAALTENPRANIDSEWFSEWSENFFGVSEKRLYNAMEWTGQLWELPVKGCDRDFSPLPYGYMNMVMHFPDGQVGRTREGHYPGNWDGIDFTAMYVKGVEGALKGDSDKIRVDYERINRQFHDAAAILESLAKRATKNRNIATVWSVFAKLKCLSIRVFGVLSGFSGDREELMRELDIIEKPFRKAVSECYEPEGATRMIDTCYIPLKKSLLKGCLGK